MYYKSLIYLVPLLIALEYLYILIAKKVGIYDLPNNRNLHQTKIVRGGGVIFLVSVMAYYFLVEPINHWLLAGFALVSLLSFIDDFKSLPSKLRLALQFFTAGMVVFTSEVSEYGYLMVMVSLVLYVGIINAYNFMDGINGITFMYSTVTMCALLYINIQQVEFVSAELMVYVLSGLIAFGFFNFRKSALCFGGDVGSVGMAFLICYFIFQLILKTEQFLWIFLLMVYGVDSIFTILERLKQRENILTPHKKHLFQLMVYKGGLTHLQVALIFGGLQLVINILLFVIINNFSQQLTRILLIFIIAVIISVVYFYIKGGLKKKEEVK